jgi:hypothetical protein
MAEQPAPRRRFQFRLRTLLIGVTLLAVPLGYIGAQMRIVKERKAWLESHTQFGLSGGNFTPSFADGDPDKAPSLIRRWLGDECRGHVEATRADADRAIALFPEATIYHSLFDEQSTGGPELHGLRPITIRHPSTQH